MRQNHRLTVGHSTHVILFVGLRHRVSCRFTCLKTEVWKNTIKTRNVFQRKTDVPPPHPTCQIPPFESPPAFASANIIIQDLGYVDIIYQFDLKICQFLLEHLKSFCDLENGIQITKTSSSLWLVIITYLYKFL